MPLTITRRVRSATDAGAGHPGLVRRTVVFVFVTKYTREVCTDFEAELKQFNGEQDHVHLLVDHPPKLQLSKLVNSPPERDDDWHIPIGRMNDNSRTPVDRTGSMSRIPSEKPRAPM